MMLLKVKCQVCGKITEQPWEFEGWFKDKPDTDKIYNGYCSDKCKNKKMEEIEKKYPENPDLEIECRTDGFLY